MSSEYTITIRANQMPNPAEIALYLKAEVLGINKVRETLVDISALMELTGLSRNTIRDKCKNLENMGTKGKALYNKDDAIAALSATNKVGRKRKN